MSIVAEELAVGKFYGDLRDRLIGELVYWIKNKIGKAKKGNSKTVKNPEEFFRDTLTSWFFLADKQGMLIESDLVRQSDIDYFLKLNGAAPEAWPREKERNLLREYRTKFSTIDKDAVPGNVAIVEKNGRYEVLIGRGRRGFPIAASQYARLLEKYQGDPSQRVYEIARIILRYSTLGINLIRTSLPPIKFDMPIHELFGNPFNSENNYCGNFEFERIFGSSGSFFDSPMVADAFYLCNPPHSEEIMNKTIKRIVEQLTHSIEKLHVCIVLPVWDAETQNELEPGRIKTATTFEALDLIKNSGFVKQHLKLRKETYKYFDQFNGTYVITVHSHLIYVCNAPEIISLENFAAKWAEQCKK
nr:phosphorylated CTD-interacting factor 1 [Kaumoebavirus]